MPEQVRGGLGRRPAHHEGLRCGAAARSPAREPHLLCDCSGPHGAVRLYRAESRPARREHDGSRQEMGRHALALSAAPASLLVAPPPLSRAQAPSAAAPLEQINVVGERPGPRLWKVTKGDHVLWLLGTLNHLPRRMTWRSGEVESALGESQELLISGPSVSAGVGPIGAIRLYVQWRRTQRNPDHLKLDVWLPAPL